MKKISAFTLLLIAFLGSLNISAEENKDSVCLEIHGKISKTPTLYSKSYVVELIHQNTVVDSKEIKDYQSFMFSLNKNSFYTIRILKQGFVPKIISVDTRLGKSTDLMYMFEFETDLIEKKEIRNLDQESLEFPITIVQYYPEVNWFYFNEEYTSNIKQAIYKNSGKKFKRNMGADVIVIKQK